MAPNPSQLLEVIKASGVKYDLVDNWDSPGHAGKQTPWAPQYLILHHTANGGADGNAPSLARVSKNSPYYPVPLCNFLVGRDGLVYVVSAFCSYHAGLGGPGKWGDGPLVASGDMNRQSYGIEIESKGTSLEHQDEGNGFTDAQVTAVSKLGYALLRLMGSNSKVAINHKTWAPGRKIDTLAMDAWWQDKIVAATPAPPKPTPPKPTPAPGRPTVDLSHLLAARKADIPAPTGHTTYPKDVLRVEKALHQENLLASKYVDGSWGTKTDEAYAGWQRRCGYTGQDADGVPGMESLTKLGKKYGFDAVA